MARQGTTHKKNDGPGSSRKWAIICVAGGILLAVGALVALVALMHARYQAKSWELTPVVEALERHEADHGHYPEKLAELVPDYLPDYPESIEGLFLNKVFDNGWAVYVT